MELDFEDFVEEVKFQMTEYDILTKELILGWEKKARKWIEKNRKKPYLSYRAWDDIMITIKNEDVPEEIARKFYHAVKEQKEEQYWKAFQLL